VLRDGEGPDRAAQEVDAVVGTEDPDQVGTGRAEQTVVGRVACTLRLHSWERRYEREALGNGIYYVCRRCGRERPLSRTEGVWQKYD
jgi:hypothetical protein